MTEKDRLTIPAILLLLSPVVLIYFLSTWPTYRYHAEDDAALLVSFKKVTDRVHLCDEEELQEFKAASKERRPHMQRADRICGSRERVPLGLYVWIDGEQALGKEIMPSGIRNDSPVYVYEEFIIPKGEHKVKVAIKSTRGEDTEYDFVFEDTFTFSGLDKIVIDYDPIEEYLFRA